MPTAPQRETCGAAGPRGIDCEGPAGHVGPHGAADPEGGDELRWSPEQAGHYAGERNAELQLEASPHVQALRAMAPLDAPFRGVVHDQGRISGGPHRGVLALGPWGVHVALVPRPSRGPAQLLLPWAEVLWIEVG